MKDKGLVDIRGKVKMTKTLTKTRQDRNKSVLVSEKNDTKNSDNKIKEEDIKSLAVVRADSLPKVKTAMYDLVRYGHLTLLGQPKTLDPDYADNILVNIMKSPLKIPCEAASIVPMAEDASIAIGRLREIHPPAHVIVLSPRNGIFHSLIDHMNTLPEMNLTVNYRRLKAGACKVASKELTMFYN